MIKEFTAVFLGGGLGSMLRFAMQLLMQGRISTASFPWATFTVNIAGSFMIGMFYALSARLNLSAEFRLFLTAGLCGGFTTFSSFSNETLTLFRHGDFLAAIIYISLSVTLGVTACFIGASVCQSRA